MFWFFALVGMVVVALVTGCGLFAAFLATKKWATDRQKKKFHKWMEGEVNLFSNRLASDAFWFSEDLPTMNLLVNMAEAVGSSRGKLFSIHVGDLRKKWWSDRQRQRNERPLIVCLCGSTRFYDVFQKANYDETMKGHIVLSVGFYPHSTAEAKHGEGVGHDSQQKKQLDELHKRKIDLADEILVLNVGGYIGESTRSEIEYARRLGKMVRMIEPPVEAREQRLKELQETQGE